MKIAEGHTEFESNHFDAKILSESVASHDFRGDVFANFERNDNYAISLSDQKAQRILNKLLQSANYDSKSFVSEIENWQNKMEKDVNQNLRELDTSILHASFAMSVVLDLLAWGVNIEIVESQIRIAKYNNKLNSTMRNDSIRDAMSGLKGKEIGYELPVDSNEALKLIQAGKFQLEKIIPSNQKNLQIFRTGVTTWSMPYRGREGRSSRFVLKVELNEVRAPCGIIEVGDDAPFSPLRDRELGFFAPPSDSTMNSQISKRLNSLRLCMRKENLPIDPSKEIHILKEEWLKKDIGKFTSEDPKIRKRMNYLSRIIRAELALSHPDLWNEIDVNAGIRAIKDVTLNRVHTEVVICGALPPFGNLLIGKMVAMMMNHPEIRASLDRDIGVLLQDTFDFHKLEAWLPRYGPLLVTTKGLYPRHSAQYNRVRIVKHDGHIPLKKLGSTIGQTMSNISDRTMRLAVEINIRLGEKGVSREYGSGGSKRQRIIQKASTIVGINPAVMYADITRPVYGLSLVTNSQAVVLAGSQPEWRDSGGLIDDAAIYEEKTVHLWRKQWLNTSLARGSRISNQEEEGYES
jgi:hypothetical protein